MYMPYIYTEDEEYDSKEEEEMSDRPRHILRLNIRSTSPSPVRKEKITSSVGGKKLKTLQTSKARPKANLKATPKATPKSTPKATPKSTSKRLSTPKISSMLNSLSKYNTINKESNTISKGAGAVSKKDIKKKPAKKRQHQVRHMNFILQMVS